jgi:hypothetical protein
MTLIATILGLPYKGKDKPKMSSPQDVSFWGSVARICLFKDLAVKRLFCTNKRSEFILTLTLTTKPRPDVFVTYRNR